MSDTTNETAETPATAAGGGEPSPSAKLLAHFTRDLSFENVAATSGKQVQGQPDIQINVGMDANPIADDRYQIALKINAKAVNGEDTRFIAELDYGGVFRLENVKKEHVHPFLFIECPRQLLPFARRVMADVTRDGGFPPLMIDNVDFAQLYRQNLEAARARRAAEAEKGEKGTAEKKADA